MRTLLASEDSVSEPATGDSWSSFGMSLTTRVDAPPLVRLTFGVELDPVAYELVSATTFDDGTTELVVRPDTHLDAMLFNEWLRGRASFPEMR